MTTAGFTPLQWLALVEHELLLFAGAFFLIGALDEFLVDLIWLWGRITGRIRTPRLRDGERLQSPLSGIAAVFIPAWREAGVIGATIRHALEAWPQAELRLYVGCYRNDPDTLVAAMAAARGDARLRLVILDSDGPSTKADCLNRLHRALAEDEQRMGEAARMVVLHDAEDMVDPAALGLLDRAIGEADFVQLPVVPIPQPASPWIAGHYGEEFAEAHGKGLVVRDLLGAGVPSAGVGCAVARGVLVRMAEAHGDGRPFAEDSLTEDYELGLGVSEMGGRTRFLRVRTAEGRLVATRACFPARLDSSVRQKTRWVHGIALQGWDRLGWGRNPAEIWMRMRDRRGPLTALVLAVAYGLLLVMGISWAARGAGFAYPAAYDPTLQLLLAINFAGFVWRGIWRFAFAARQYGVQEGLRAVMRIPVSNLIAIMAGRRALFAYARSLAGERVVWDKTDHAAHPVLMREQGARV
ncbi:MAG: glycosyl transferase family protein [Sphingomonadales bacterium]|nr:glycosyl transferase family protein [Sphingomonadales bacterium]MBD3773689.1 glycosyl transferase family protein [Paracoccaceae bacterium]